MTGVDFHHRQLPGTVSTAKPGKISKMMWQCMGTKRNEDKQESWPEEQNGYDTVCFEFIWQ